LLRALDAENFINVRKIVGGPAPEAVKPEIARAKREMEEMRAWLDHKCELMKQYPQLIRKAATAK
jgi:hypothetical protein